MRSGCQTETHLDEHLGSVSEAGVGGCPRRVAEGAHGLAVARELQRELLLPHGLNAVVHSQGCVPPRLAALVEAEGVHLLRQHRQGCLRGLPDLLKGLLVLRADERKNTYGKSLGNCVAYVKHYCITNA